MLLVIETSEKAKTVIAVFGIGVIEAFQEFEFTDAGFVPAEKEKLMIIGEETRAKLTSTRDF
jgi:hypothetical protein